MKSKLIKISVRLPESVVEKVDGISKRIDGSHSDIYRHICEFGLNNFDLIDLNLDEKMMRKIKSYSKKLKREPAYVVQKALEKFFKIENIESIIQEKVEDKIEVVEENIQENVQSENVDVTKEWEKFGF